MRKVTPKPRSARTFSALIEYVERRILLSTYAVNTLSDAANPGAGLLTFRQAVADANTHAGADTVAFSSQVFTPGAMHTITLTQGQIEFTDTGGATTVTGPGATVATLNGNKASRIFFIDNNVSVTLAGLTMTGGKQTDDEGIGITSGGAIYSGGALTVSNCTISGNAVVASGNRTLITELGPSAGGGYGGAIDSGGLLIITGTTLSDNSVTNTATVMEGGLVDSGAAYGGAIFAAAGVSLTNDILSGNSVTGSATVTGFGGAGRAFGGAVYAGAGSSIVNSTISGNTAAGGAPDDNPDGGHGGDASGGGVFGYGSLAFANCQVTGNHLYAGRTNLVDDNGGAAQGGGIYAGGILSITGTSVTDNTAYGGGVHSNVEPSGGGGIFAATDANVTSARIDGNILQGGTDEDETTVPAVAGGGIDVGGQLQINNTSVSNNSVSAVGSSSSISPAVGGLDVGGGIAVTGTSSITSCTIANDSVTAPSGAESSELLHVSGGEADGGGIYGSSALTVTNATVAGNSTVGGSGAASFGGPAGADGGNANGGGIYSLGILTVSDCTVTGNNCVAGTGGAGSTFGTPAAAGADGTAVGGGIENSFATVPVINNSIVSANNAAGVFNDIGSAISLTGANNLVGVGGGLTNGVNGNLVGINDPMLFGLGNYGGGLPTMLPMPGSLVIDAGNNNLVPVAIGTDERGFARIVGVAVDIGATEVVNASISGIVFDDTNGNAARDAGESGIAKITLYNDANNDGKLDEGEPSTVTDSLGNYDFAGLGGDNYKIREVLPAGWKQTTPANGFGWTLTLAVDQSLTGKNFGEQTVSLPPPPPTGGSISGTVFNDLNGNGALNAGEIGIVGIVIYNDANNNGKKDSGEVFTTTDTSGNYTLSSLAAGSYKIREILPAGSKQTSPANNFGWTLALGVNQTLTAKNFGEQTAVAPPATGASISGSVFNDANKNGKRDSGEAGLSAWSLYIDLNNDGVQDNGEVAVKSLADGSYSFGGLKAGTYIVRAIRPSGWNQTTPTNNLGQHVTVAANQSKTGVVFGEHSGG